MSLLYIFLFTTVSSVAQDLEIDASYTIPLIKIETKDHKEIEDKETYIDGELFLDIPDGEEWKDFGESLEGSKIQIKGRGNFTWYKTDKKSYKIKFDKKTSLLGMPESKHFAIISYDSFYPTLWVAPYVGMEIARLIEPGWTPRMQPVEVILNQEYKGIYLFVETIRSEKTRLNIKTQEDNNENEESLPYGWIVELDNQDDDCQIQIPSKNRIELLRVTYKEPEELSEVQKEWLSNEFIKLTGLIENPLEFTDDQWINHFDLESIARYMIVREVLHDIDGYSGSQYYFKDQGNEKWVAGPFWDMELWPHEKPGWIVDNGEWSLLNWIPFMMQSPELRTTFLTIWDEFYQDKFSEIYDIIDNLKIYQQADEVNNIRWPKEDVSLDYKLEMAKARLTFNADWIDKNKEWEITEESNGIDVVHADKYFSVSIYSGGIYLTSYSNEIENIQVYDMEGKLMINEKLVYANSKFLDSSHLTNGLFIILVKLKDRPEYLQRKVLIKK